jgi:hypothetical protein
MEKDVYMSDDIIQPADDQSKDNGIGIPVEWYVPDDLPTRYATNMTLQRTEHEFVLSFYEQKIPLLFGAPEDIQKRASEITSVRATCVSRLIIANGRFPGFVEALQQALNDFRASEAEKE